MANSAWREPKQYDFSALRSALCPVRSKFILSLARPPAEPLYPSGAPIKPDDDIIAINDNRNFASTVRIFKHSVHLIGFVDYADVVDLHSFFLIGFTSRIGIGSCVFTENENAIRH